MSYFSLARRSLHAVKTPTTCAGATFVLTSDPSCSAAVCGCNYAQAFVVLGTSLCGAQAAFVLTNGQPLSAATTGSAAAVAASTAPADAEAATNPAADEPAETDDVAAQHQRLRQRLAAAAAAAQARQRVTAAAAAAAQAGNPALEAAAAAEAAGVMHPPNVARLRLWDPLSGHCVPVRDPACELREVSWPH